MRKKIVAGNWKMNKTLDEAKTLASEVMNGVKKAGDEVKVVLCIPFPYLLPIKHLIGDHPAVSVGAQNCSDHQWGAYTGEVSAPMLKSIGISYVIIGHSERRQYFEEEDKMLAQKTDAAIANGLTPIYCCGESLLVREANEQNELVRAQIKEGLFHLPAEGIKKVVIAYEPVWAIGTGKTATSQQAQEMHAVIREQLKSKYGEDVSASVSILYGGSVNAGNAKELFGCADVDGGLVGGASLKSKEFVDIIKSI